MASETFGNTIIVTTSFTDAVSTYAAAGTLPSWVQNRGPKNIIVAYSSSATPPIDGGKVLRTFESTSGNSSHIWVKSLGGANSSITVGLVG